MKKFISIIMILIVSSSLFAQRIQIQKGLVRKIIYSKDDPIIPLSNVKIVIETESRSDDHGRFTAKIPVNHDQSFTIKKVSYNKDGINYEMVYPIKNASKCYLSPNDLLIILASPDEIEAERLKDLRNIRSAARRNINKLEDELDKKNEELSALHQKDIYYKKVEYERDSLQAICRNYYSNYSQVEREIAEQAEALSKIDYGVLDSLEREKVEMRKAGRWLDLQKILQKEVPGDVMEVARKIAESNSINKQRGHDLTEAVRQNEKEKEDILQVSKKVCRNLLERIENFKMQFQNDSIIKCYNALITIDSTNWHYLNDAGNFMSIYKADYKQAMDFYQLASKCITDNHQLAETYNNIGEVYKYQGDYQEALGFYNKSIKLLDGRNNDNSEEIATYYNNIGQIYDSNGDYKKALEYYQKSLNIWMKIHGVNHSDIAISYNNISHIYNINGDYEKALEYYRKALDIWQKTLGDNHPYIADSYNNIGYVYKVKGDFSTALEYYQKALDKRLKILGNLHPDVAESYGNIGGVYISLNELPKALEYYQKALDIRLKMLGDNHPSVGINYNNIGAVYSSMGENPKAIDFYQKALDILSKKFDKYHPNIANIYNCLGDAYYNENNYIKALDFYQKAFNIWSKIYGDNHPDVAISYNNIGGIYDTNGDYTKALDYYQKALDIWLKFYGEKHPYIAISYNNISDAYSSQDNYIKALEYYQKSLSIKIKLYGENNKSTQSTISQMINCYNKALQKDSDNMGLRKEFLRFMSNKTFTATVIDGDYPAYAKGLRGTYYILYFEGWDIHQMTNLIKLNKALQGKPKKLLLMQDGKISVCQFDNQLGVQLGITMINKRLKNKMIKKYTQWKDNNKL